MQDLWLAPICLTWTCVPQVSKLRVLVHLVAHWYNGPRRTHQMLETYGGTENLSSRHCFSVNQFPCWKRICKDWREKLVLKEAYYVCLGHWDSAERGPVTILTEED